MNKLQFKDMKITPVSAQLRWTDYLGHFKARWAIGRMNYRVDPGLYAVGSTGADSIVLISANYKMSFDRLRKQLSNRDAWILVLDTKGINVWCAAGKGTFATDELVNQIELSKLKEIVNHKIMIVPQLGAPGISAHKVQQATGFKVVYGPVRVEDLPAFLDAGNKATDKMREVTFNLWERTVLMPVELVMGAKYAIMLALLLFLLSGFDRTGYLFEKTLSQGIINAVFLISVFLAAVVLGPILLPWLPGKPFSLKGLWIGLAIDIWLIAGLFQPSSCPCVFIFSQHLMLIGWLLAIPALTSVVVMNFTGTSTYTSLSGVRKEMKIAIPFQATAAITGLTLWTIGLFV